MDEEQAKAQVVAEIDRLEREARAVIERYGYKLSYINGRCFIGDGTTPLPDDYMDAHDRANAERSRRLAVARAVAARLPELRGLIEENRPTWALARYLSSFASVYRNAEAEGLVFKAKQQARAQKPRERSGSIASAARRAVASGAQRYAEARKAESSLQAPEKRSVTQALSRAKRRKR